MKLSIIIPYHNEPFETVYPLFECLNNQTGVDFNDMEILFSNNCTDPIKPKFIEDKFFDNICDRIKYVIPSIKNYSGMSRQYCLDMAVGDYVMFCDDDDILYSITTLSEIISNIDQDRINGHIVDYYTFFERIENYSGDGEISYYTGTNLVLVHGKVYRTEYLRSHNVRFHYKLETHDDVYFNLILNGSSPITKNLSTPIYLWKYNPRSVSHQQEYDRLTAIDGILKGFYAYKKIRDEYNKNIIVYKNDIYGSIRFHYNEIKSFKNIMTEDEISNYENVLAMYIKEIDKDLGCLSFDIDNIVGEEPFEEFVHRILTSYTDVEKCYKDKYYC